MTKWEYKTVIRSRGFDKYKDNPKAPWKYATDWNIDIGKTLKEFGDDGWELVAVTSRSSYLGGFSQAEGSGYPSISVDYSGFTSDEVWIFKRPKSE